jgi:RNA polymerase sigma-B factor
MTSTLESPTTAAGSLPSPCSPSTSTKAEQHAHRATRTADLLARAHAAADDAERQQLIEEVVRINMRVAEAVSSRFRRRGVPDDDLAQVAYLGLVKAAQGFTPSFQRDFLAYAVPTIRGEVRRYFRDRAWTVRPPRRLQELQPRLAVAREELSQQLGRSPRPSEVADYLEVDPEEVIEALSTDGCFAPLSLDHPRGEDGVSTLGDIVGSEDGDVGAVEARHMLAPAIEALSERDRRILYLRFFAQQTQREIAEDIGVTQMQVSRLLGRILSDLRKVVGD